MTLTAVYREPCGALNALVTDVDVSTACGITCDRTWWCECGIYLVGRHVGPAAVCRHLRALGMAPKETAS